MHSVYPMLHQNAEWDSGNKCVPPLSSSHPLALICCPHSFANKSVDKLMQLGIAKTHLGKTITVEGRDSQEFGRKIAKYVDSKEKELGKRKKRGSKASPKKKDETQEVSIQDRAMGRGVSAES